MSNPNPTNYNINVGPVVDPIARLTDRARRVIELSLREALQLGHNYIGTEHLLLAIIREGEGVGAVTLTENLGISLTQARQAVIQRLSGYKKAEAAKPQTAVTFRDTTTTAPAKVSRGDALRLAAETFHGDTPENIVAAAKLFETYLTGDAA